MDKRFATEMLHFSVLKWPWYLITSKSERYRKKLLNLKEICAYDLIYFWNSTFIVVLFCFSLTSNQ